MQVLENPDKSFLQHIMSIFQAFGVPIAHTQHLRRISVVELFLRPCMVAQTALYYFGFMGHRQLPKEDDTACTNLVARRLKEKQKKG
jgi:hypothetical protein